MTSTTKANPDGLEIRLEGLHRRFGSVRALDDLSITLAPGELVALLGPSGCGKTTALRVVAGLDEPDEGRVVVGDCDVTKVPANKRDMGMVFQAYSLFPHLTSAQNVEFGLKLRGVDRVKRSARAKEMLELAGLSAHAGRYASQLSGGQQQLVALARALAIEPGVLLLDEPLSALDAKVRAQLREEIRRVQLEVGTTTLFVTHALRRTGDPVRGRVVGLMNHIPTAVASGRADILGSTVGARAGSIDNGAGIALVRPEQLTVAASQQGSARVITASFLGSISRVRVRVRMANGRELLAQATGAAAAGLAAEQPVSVGLADKDVLVVEDL